MGEIGAGMNETMKMTTTSGEEDAARAIEWHVVIDGRRMLPAEEPKQGDEQHDPGNPRIGAGDHDEQQQGGDGPDGDPTGVPAEQRVRHVAAVELPGGDEIHHREQQAKPSSQRGRMQVDRVARGDGAGQPPCEPLKQQRFTEREPLPDQLVGQPHDR